MNVVYAADTTMAGGPDGVPVLVVAGTHWLATDPVVRCYPALFTSDPFPTLSFTGPKPERPTGGEPAPVPVPVAPRREVRRGQ